MPDGICRIEALSFDNCRNLIGVVLPDSIVELETNFSSCNKLVYVRLPRAIERIDDLMFGRCSELKSIRIPESVKVLGYDVLKDSAIQELIIEGCLDEIESFRAQRCTNLRRIIFLDAPPLNVTGDLAKGWIGLFMGDSDVTIYYLNTNQASWAPNGETEWLSRPLIGIDSLDDLPPLD